VSAPTLVLVLALGCGGGGAGGVPDPGGGGASPPPPVTPGPPSAEDCRAALTNLWRLEGLAGAPDDTLVEDCTTHANKTDVSCVMNAADATALSACGGLRAP
jgi:hypothetical protein